MPCAARSTVSCAPCSAAWRIRSALSAIALAMSFPACWIPSSTLSCAGGVTGGLERVVLLTELPEVAARRSCVWIACAFWIIPAGVSEVRFNRWLMSRPERGVLDAVYVERGEVGFFVVTDPALPGPPFAPTVSVSGTTVILTVRADLRRRHAGDLCDSGGEQSRRCADAGELRHRQHIDDADGDERCTRHVLRARPCREQRRCRTAFVRAVPDRAFRHGVHRTADGAVEPCLNRERLDRDARVESGFRIADVARRGGRFSRRSGESGGRRYRQHVRECDVRRRRLGDVNFVRVKSKNSCGLSSTSNEIQVVVR